MLITGMKEKVFLEKIGKCGCVGLWLVNCTERPLAFVACWKVELT